MKKLFLIASITASSYASIVDVDAYRKMNEVQFDIQTLKSDEGLSLKSKASLDSLGAIASQLAEDIYKGNCTKISINEIPNKRCQTLNKSVVKFMDAYTKVTNKIFISRLASLEQYENKTEKMKVCAQAMTSFINAQASPEVLYPLSINFASEEIEDNEMKLQYTIELKSAAKDTNLFRKINKIYDDRNEWKSKCREYITYRLQGDDIRTAYNMPTKNFIKTINEIYQNTNFVFGVSERGDRYTTFAIGWRNPVKYAILIKNGRGEVVHKFIAEYVFGRPFSCRTIDCTKNSPQMWQSLYTGVEDLSGYYGYTSPYIRLTSISSYSDRIEQSKSESHFGTIKLPADNYTIEMVLTNEKVKIEEWAD